MSVNKVILLGRLGQEPKLTFTSSGTPVCQFSLATSENWMKDGQKQEKTEWHKIVVWGKLAEVCNQYLQKGKQVYLEGRLQTRSWDDKNGQKRYSTEINADKVEFVGQKSSQDGAESASGVQSEYNASTDASFSDSEIPF